MMTHILLIVTALGVISVINKLMENLVQIIIKLTQAIFLVTFVLLTLAVIAGYVKLH